MGIYKPGLACGAASFIAAGTAMYEALAARIVSNILSPILSEIEPLRNATKIPLKSGRSIENATGKYPFFQKADNFLPLTIPISSRNTARKPLNISEVKGAIPLACSSFARKPIRRLPLINNTLPFVRECLSSFETDIFALGSFLKI
jgi:hypothetical protein